MAPFEPPRRMTAEEFRRISGVPEAPVGKRADLVSTPSVMNKTETRYSLYLDALLAAKQIACYRFQPYKLRLADLTFFTLDFAVRDIALDAEGRNVRIIDVKGTLSNKPKPLVKDDAQVKIKVAAYEFRDLHPDWLFQQAWYTKDGWVHKNFVSRY